MMFSCARLKNSVRCSLPGAGVAGSVRPPQDSSSGGKPSIMPAAALRLMNSRRVICAACLCCSICSVIVSLRFTEYSYQVVLTDKPLHTGGCGADGGKVGDGGVSYHPGVVQLPISRLLFQRGLPLPLGV